MEYKLSPGEETKIATKEILCQKNDQGNFNCNISNVLAHLIIFISFVCSKFKL